MGGGAMWRTAIRVGGSSSPSSAAVASNAVLCRTGTTTPAIKSPASASISCTCNPAEVHRHHSAKQQPSSGDLLCVPMSPLRPMRSPSHVSVKRTSMRLSRSKCAICLEAMKPGLGQALFTAECSHCFHFSCISSNVRHGNLVCPVCRAKWKEVPWQAPSEIRKVNQGGDAARSHHRTPRQSPQRLPHRSPHPNARGVRRTSPPEPSMFDDDEPLGEGTSQPDACNDLSEVGGKSQESKGLDNVKVVSYPEVGAVAYSEIRDGFTVLVHLKAPCASRRPRNGGSSSPWALSPLREGMKGRDISLESPSPSPPHVSGPGFRAPLDLVTVLDVSGSMAGTKLVLLKRAMGFVIRNLTPVDRLSVVVFSSTAKRLFPLRRMVQDGRQSALRAIEALVSTGGTNIAEGLRKGAKVLEDRQMHNPVASIMLLSDGQDTCTLGSTGHHSITRLHPASEYQQLLPASIRNSRFSGQTPTPVHTFGFGADHDAATMHKIADISGGTFSFIQAEGVVQDAFAQCIGGLLSVVVQDSQLIISSGSSGVELKSIQAGSYDSIIQESGTHGFVKLGDMYAEEERDILLELHMPALEKLPVGDPPLSTLLQVGCSYKDPVSQEVKQTPVQQVCIVRPALVEGPEQERTSIEVDRQRNRLLTAQAIVEAGSLADMGDIARAQFVLKTAKTALQSSAAAQVGDQLTSALELELTEIQVRMANRQMYERTGRAYILSAQSSHLKQRATTRGSFVDSQSRDYQTPSMVDMILRSQTLSPAHYSASASSTPNLTPNVTPSRDTRRGSSMSGPLLLSPSPSRVLLRRSSGRVQDSHCHDHSSPQALPGSSHHVSMLLQTSINPS
ncbi:unnamed protein product [Sphagnum compactum]